MTAATGRLADLLDRVDRLLVVRGPSVTQQEVLGVCVRPGLQVGLSDVPGRPPPDAPDGVLLVVRDRMELRRVVGACQSLPGSPRLGCVLLDSDRPPLTAGRPGWPAVLSVVAESSPVCFTFVELAAPLRMGHLTADLARRSTPRHLMSPGWPVLALDRGSPQMWTPGDPLSVVGRPEEIHDLSGDYPADVVVTDGSCGARDQAQGRSAREHHVLGSLPRALHLAAPMTWSDYHEQGAERSDRQLAAEQGLALGGVDSQLVNPQGFRRRAAGPVHALTAVPEAPHLCRVECDDGPVLVDTRHGPGERDLTRLRTLRGVHVDWQGATGPRDYARLVVALAMAGVPLTCDPAPTWARAQLHPDLLAATAGRTDLDDPMAREVRSILARRAALTRHSADAWRRRVAEATGAAGPAAPRVSVLLPTRRPDLLGFALRQVARQRGVELELVLATHGHEPDQRLLAEVRESASLQVTAVTAPADEPFGSLLNLAAGAATGDLLLKMDDDDWYGPHFVADLLLARGYSGADVTGTPPEFTYVEALDLTVRRKDATESFRPVVAGGTMLVTRECLTAVGGFRRMRRYVDAGLLQGVLAAGGSVYRTHGHSYLLRRGGSGHTWDPGLGYFVSRSRTAEQWRGFRPSVLLEADDADRPAASAQPTRERSVR
jgi:hypothetical protein